MKMKFALFALATALFVPSVALGDTVCLFIMAEYSQGLLFTGKFDISTQKIVNDSSSTLTIDGLNIAGFVNPIREHYRVLPVNFWDPEAPTNTNDNVFYFSHPNFSTAAGGLLLQFTDGPNLGDYIWITSNGTTGNAAMVNNFNIYDLHQNQLAGEDFFETSTTIIIPDYFPEPSSFLLLGTGMLCLAGLLSWKSKSRGSVRPSPLS